MSTTLPPPHILPYAIPIKDIPQIQKRIGLMGRSGSGKTFSALTFPNPVVADIDGNLSGLMSKENVSVLQFTSKDWIRDKLGFKYNANTVLYPIKDAFLYFLKGDAQKLQASQTLIVDSWTTLQIAFDQQRTLEPKYNNGVINDFAFWADKIDYSEDVLQLFKTLKCDVVVTFHEQDQRDALGKLNGKVEPLMEGKFNKRIGLHFTEFYRCVVESKLDAAKNTVGSIYRWQTASDSEVMLKTRMQGCNMFIEPNASSIKYN